MRVKMINLGGDEAEIKFTIDVKRAETGKVETFEMIGKVIDGGIDGYEPGNISGSINNTTGI